MSATKDPWVVCTVAAKDVTAEWLAEALKSGAYMRTEPNGDVIVRYQASQLEKRPN